MPKRNMTNGEIDRLGERIKVNGKPNAEDLDLLQEFRKSYKDPLSRVFETLRNFAIKVDKEAIVTFRIKRIDTIIRKLHRFKDNPEGSMALSRMWDIAGCRCIFNSNEESLIYRLRDALIKEYGECKINDHVSTPKKDGYRSLHIYIQDKILNKKIEVQIRTTKQHNWATLVEIIDLIYSTKIKEGSNNVELQRFLFLFSKKENLNKDDKNELIKIERKYRIFKRMSEVFSKNYINIRRQWISQNQNNGSFYVIEAKNDFSSTIDLYRDFEEAESEYYLKYVSNSESNILLTYIKNAKFKQISKAYSNYVLTMHSFFEDYKTILEEQVLEKLRSGNFFSIWKSLNRYRKTTIVYLKNIRNEIQELNNCQKDNTIKRNHKKEWEKDLVKEISSWQQSTDLFFKQQASEIKSGSAIELLVITQIKLLTWQVK